MSNTPITEAALEVVPPSALEAITQGEVSCQIATAHKYPRSMATFKRRATDMATIDVDTAESCIYVRPVGGGKFAEGLSVRMAEIVGASYGNLRVGSMIVEQTDRYVVTRGFAHDLETNFASTSECKEPTVTKDGRPYSEGQRAVVAKAALAKARRDATFQVVPKALCRPIETAARALIAGNSKSLDERKAAAVQWIQRLKIAEERVWKALGIVGAEDLTSEILLTLTGIRNAIKDEDTTIDEAFPPVIAQGKIGNPLDDAAKKKTTPKGDDAEPTKEQKAAYAEQSKPAAAAQEKPKVPQPTPEPETPAGPSADELRAQVLQKAKAEASMGKAIVIDFFGGPDAWAALEAGTLADALAAWPETLEAIKAK